MEKIGRVKWTDKHEYMEIGSDPIKNLNLVNLNVVW